MNKNVNVFIGVLLCAVLCGMFVWLSSTEDADFWSPSEMYNEVSGASAGGYSSTSATLSGYSNDGGLALGLSSSSLSRARSSSFYAGAYSGAATMPLTSNLSPLTYGGASGAGLHLTSSAEVKSFGGGGNAGAAMGSAMRSNSTSLSLQGGAGVGSISSPISHTSLKRGSASQSVDYAANMEDAIMAAAPSVGTYASQMYGGLNSTIANNYGGSIYGSSTGVQGRRNIGNVIDNYFGWLGSGKWDYGNGAEGLTESDLRSLYAAITGDTDFSNEAEWNAFYDWFMNQINNNGYVQDGDKYWFMAPLSDAIPFVLLLCMLYAFVVYRKAKNQVVKDEQ